MKELFYRQVVIYCQELLIARINLEPTESNQQLFEGKIEFSLYQHRIEIYSDYDIKFEDEGEWYEAQNKSNLDAHCKPWEITTFLKGEMPFTTFG